MIYKYFKNIYIDNNNKYLLLLLYFVIHIYYYIKFCIDIKIWQMNT